MHLMCAVRCARVSAVITRAWRAVSADGGKQARRGARRVRDAPELRARGARVCCLAYRVCVSVCDAARARRQHTVDLYDARREATLRMSLVS